MDQGRYTYPSIIAPKGCVYTQSLGVHPDRISLRCVPQNTAIASSGNVVLSYGLTTLTLPNCVFDTARIAADVSHGFLLSVVLFDRREWWRFAPPISGYYNIYRAYEQVTGKKKSLRQLAQLLFTHIGEPTADVSLLSDAIYPEVRWECDSPVIMLDNLLKEWGFSVSLGFNSEIVKVVQLGTGASLNLTNAMMLSSTVDPKVRPHYIRLCFGPSIMQARFKLEAVAWDTDGTWKTLDAVSYKPAAGWSREDPLTLPSVKNEQDEKTYNIAKANVYKKFRVVKFAPDTLDIPDGSGTVTNIEQCFPLKGELLDSEKSMGGGWATAMEFRIYGKLFIEARDDGQPAQDKTTTIDDEYIGEYVTLDGEKGIVDFEDPMFWVDGADIKPAELFLECCFGINDPTYNAPYHYEKDTILDAGGFGYRGVHYPELEGRKLIQYSAGHVPSSWDDNQAELDAVAALVAASISGQYTNSGSQVVVYNIPIFSLRCDGAIHQVQFIISDGTAHAGSYSMASRNEEFDRFIMTRDERTAGNNSLLDVMNNRSKSSLERRKEKADD